MAEGDAPVAIDSEVSGTSDRVPAGRTGWDVCGTGSCAEALVAGGGVVEVGSEVDIGTEISDARLLCGWRIEMERRGERRRLTRYSAAELQYRGCCSRLGLRG